MDNHGSHRTPEFIQLANEHHIRPFPFPAHLTHCMQPLDVGLFHPYKHWQQVALNKSLANLIVDYSMIDFLGDLAGIRDKTFTKKNIQSAWLKSGMYPPNSTAYIKQIKNFNPPEKPKEKDQGTMPRTPTKPVHMDYALTEKWDNKIAPLLSSPSKKEYESFSRGAKYTMAEASIKAIELENLLAQRAEEAKRKARSRKVTKQYGLKGKGLTLEDATQIKEDKIYAETAKEARKERNNFMKLWRVERDKVKAEGVEARKRERERVREVKKLMNENLVVPPELLIPIVDESIEWFATNPVWLEEQHKKEVSQTARQIEGNGNIENKEEEEPIIIVDTMGDSSLASSIALPPYIPLIADESMEQEWVARGREMDDIDENTFEGFRYNRDRRIREYIVNKFIKGFSEEESGEEVF